MFYQHCFSGLLKVHTQEKCPASVKYLFQLNTTGKLSRSLEHTEIPCEVILL